MHYITKISNTTLQIRDCCEKFNIQCLELDKAKGNEDPSGRIRPEIIEEVRLFKATYTYRHPIKNFYN